MALFISFFGLHILFKEKDHPSTFQLVKFPFVSFYALSDIGTRNKEITTVKRSSYCFGALLFGAEFISEEVAGFSPFMVSPRKNTVFIVSCV